MGKVSTSKKVSKVARTGGGRTKRSGQQRALLFPSIIAVAVILGVFLVIFSRDQRQPDTSPPQPGDHWHAAIGFYICDEFAPDVPDNGNDPAGIHGHSDGIVHVHPFFQTAGGSRAVLDLYFDALDLDVTSSGINIPTAEARENGDLCGSQPGEVVTKVWDTRAANDQGRIVEGDPGDLRLRDNMLITVAFVPEGTAASAIPRPPSEPTLDNLSDVPSATTTTVAGSTTTTAAASTTTTVAGGSATTAAP